MELSTAEDLIITQAVKGRGIIIKNNDEYLKETNN